MIVVWLTVLMLIKGEQHPVMLDDRVMPDRESCVVAAEAALDKAAAIDGDFELQATCSIVKTKGDPA
jgi:hypothetical protein